LFAIVLCTLRFFGLFFSLFSDNIKQSTVVYKSNICGVQPNKKGFVIYRKIVRRFVSFENFVALQVYKHIGKLLRNRQQFSIRFQVRTMLFCSTAGENDSDLSGAKHTREETVSLLRTLSSTQFLSH